MRNRVNDYYLKNGGLDLTMLDQTEKLQEEITIEANNTSIEEESSINGKSYEGRYISLKNGKIPSREETVRTDNPFIREEVEGQDQESVRPYMSEEIQSVLKEMGEYLLEDGNEVAATLDEGIGILADTYNEANFYEEAYEELENYDAYALEMSEVVEAVGTLELEDNELDSLKAIDRQSFRLRQYELLKGKILIDDIISSKGEYIGRQGEMITHYMIQLAEEKKCMIKMIMHSK